MKVYNCRLIDIARVSFSMNANIIYKAKVALIDEDIQRGYKADDVIITSAVKSVDFERGLIVTQNSLYLFK